MKRKALVLLTSGLVVLGAVGCGPAPDQSVGGQISDNGDISMGNHWYWGERKLPDGRTVGCIMNKGGYAGGISCDWENAK